MFELFGEYFHKYSPTYCIFILSLHASNADFRGGRCDHNYFRACLSFTFNIIPLCDVAQTFDCGTHCHLFSVISPLCGVALTPDCGIVILVFSSRGVIQTLVWPSVFYFGISGGLPPDFSFVSHASLSLCLIALVNLCSCIVFTFVIFYVRTILRVLS